MKATLTALCAIAVLFGIATIVAGGRVLAGADPGYEVYSPLLIFNTLMGLAYVGAGYLMWGSVERGRRAALAILLLNAAVWSAIVVLYRLEMGVAVDSVRAMALRTVVWLLLYLGLAWVMRRGNSRATDR